MDTLKPLPVRYTPFPLAHLTGSAGCVLWWVQGAMGVIGRALAREETAAKGDL